SWAHRSAPAWSRGRAASSGGGVPTAAARILELQRTAGNRAVSQALAGAHRGLAVQRAPDPTAADVVSGAERGAPRRVPGSLGLTPGGKKEAGGLRKRIAGDHLTT